MADLSTIHAALEAVEEVLEGFKEATQTQKNMLNQHLELMQKKMDAHAKAVAADCKKQLEEKLESVTDEGLVKATTKAHQISYYTFGSIVLIGILLLFGAYMGWWFQN